MDQNPLSSSLFPPQPIPDGADAFSRQVHTLLDGHPKDEAAVARAFDGMGAMFDRIAAGLYSLASMLVGEGEESVRLVETAVATADIASCATPLEGRKSSRRALARAALQFIERNHPGSLAAPAAPASQAAFEARVSCIEDDDLESAGVSAEELAHMIAGPDRDRVRQWLAGLPIGVRTVFALRAVAGFTAPETASLLAANGAPSAAGWNPDSVRELFRQGLCSLASQLLHASATR
jgi:hypothetical protein